MLYVVDVQGALQVRIFFTGKVLWHYSQSILKLACAQWQVTLQTLGVLHRTATDTLDTYTNIFPFHLLLDKIILWSALQMATLSLLHPLHVVM